MNELENQTEKIKLQIQNFLGSKDTKQILENIIKNHSTIKNIGLPVYVMSGKTGSGCTTFAKILAEIIENYRILPKISMNNFIEMQYPCSDMKEEYNQFFEAFRWTAETTNIFYGVALIDISNYVRNIDNTHFIELLNFIKENKENIVFILRVDTFDKQEINEIQAVIEKYSYTEHLELPYLETKKYIKYIIDKCKINNITFIPEDKISEILKTYIDDAKDAKYFSGLHTINTFISFLTYNQIKNKNSDGNIEVTEEILKELAENFFAKMSVSYKKIGF